MKPEEQENPYLVKAVGIVGVALIFGAGCLLGLRIADKAAAAPLAAEVHAMVQKLDQAKHDCTKNLN